MCEYCDTDLNNKAIFEDDSRLIEVENLEGYLLLYTEIYEKGYGSFSVDAYIKYCPMCGRESKGGNR